MSDEELDDFELESLTLSGEQYLLFVLADETFAIPVMQIREIISFSNPTPVPKMPSYFKGVINLRGRAVPVISLAQKFFMPEKEADKRTCITIVEVDIGTGDVLLIGFVVDKVLQVLDIAEDKMEPPPSMGVSVDTRFIQNMARLDERYIVILDVCNVLTIEEVKQVTTAQGVEKS